MAGFFDGSAPDHDHLRDIRGDDQRGANQHGNDHGRSEGLGMHLIPPIDRRNDAGILFSCRVFCQCAHVLLAGQGGNGRVRASALPVGRSAVAACASGHTGKPCQFDGAGQGFRGLLPT